LLKFVATKGGTGTASVSELHFGTLWKALSFNLPPGCWRGAINGKGLVASVHCEQPDGGKRSLQHILSCNWLHQSTRVPENESDTETEDEERPTMPFYDRNSLMGQTLNQLKEICRAWSIRTATRKTDIIENILTRVGVVHKQMSAVEQMARQISTQYFSGNGKLHQCYREHFNWVDIANRSWNQVEEHHHHRDWRIKCLLSLMRFAVLNAMTHSKQNHGESWLQFRLTVAKILVQSKP